MTTQISATRRADMEAFDKARSTYVEHLAAAPDESLTYLKAGDDYALGGLVHHVNAILEHYGGVLDAIVASGFQETDTADRPGLFEGANAKARAGVTRAELSAGLAATAQLHTSVVGKLSRFSDADFERKAPVRYAPGADPYPTSPADVLGWLSDHYEEHVPHIEQLLGSWKESKSR
jgi:hypothetical protein